MPIGNFSEGEFKDRIEHLLAEYVFGKNDFIDIAVEEYNNIKQRVIIQRP